MRFPDNEFEILKKYLVMYDCALENVVMRMEVLLKDFRELRSHNPIEHFKYRLKSPESIANKLERQKFEIKAENVRRHLTDIAGVRLICSYAKDIIYMAEVLKRQPDLTVMMEKDYITNPKPNGYRSYHLIFEVPVYLSNSTEYLPVEVQLRTQSMDFWATLEHKAKYKYSNDMPPHMIYALKECADEIAGLDEKMNKIQEIVQMAY